MEKKTKLGALVGPRKEDAIAALQALAHSELTNEELVVRRFRAELERAKGTGASAAELYQALTSAGYQLSRQAFEEALANASQNEPHSGQDHQASSADSSEPVAGFTKIYNSGQF